MSDASQAGSSAGGDTIWWQRRLAWFAVAALTLLLALPVLVALLLSLQQAGDADPFAGPFGLDAWGAAFGNSDLWFLLLRSTALAGAVALVASMLAIAPAYLAAVIGGRWRQVVLVLCLIAVLGDQAVIAVGWSEVSRQVTRWLIDPDASSGRYVIGGVMTFIAETQRALPLAILCQWLAMSRHDPALIEAGLECGAHHARLLRWVVWPLAWPGVLIGLLLGFALSLGAALEPALLNTGAMSLGEQLQQILELDGNWPQGSRLALLIIGLILLALLAIALLLTMKPFGQRQPSNPHLSRPVRSFSSLGPPQAVPLASDDPLLPAALIALAWLALPLAWMLGLSLRYLFGIAVTAGPFLFVQAVISDPRLLPAIGISLIAALIAALLASFAGAGLAMWWRNLLARGTLGWRDWSLLLLAALPFILPSLLLSTLHLIAHLFLAIYLPSGLGIIAVVLADALRAMPVTAAIMLIFWCRQPADLDEIAREFALDRPRMWRLIVQPSQQPAWGIAILTAVLQSLGDFQLANALSGDRAMLSPSLLAGIATQRSPVYLALIGPLLALTAWLCRLILTRLDRRLPIRSPQGNAGGLGLSMNITARKT